mmetsp:Transcript_169069/g.537200  ORF Transcript_169069/g.537200 Transcript_169069/m.537200 type:complete len:507 (+) Transcript_169069:284-1804(+)
MGPVHRVGVESECASVRSADARQSEQHLPTRADLQRNAAEAFAQAPESPAAARHKTARARLCRRDAPGRELEAEKTARGAPTEHVQGADARRARRSAGQPPTHSRSRSAEPCSESRLHKSRRPELLALAARLQGPPMLRAIELADGRGRPAFQRASRRSPTQASLPHDALGCHPRPHPALPEQRPHARWAREGHSPRASHLEHGRPAAKPNQSLGGRLHGMLQSDRRRGLHSPRFVGRFDQKLRPLLSCASPPKQLWGKSLRQRHDARTACAPDRSCPSDSFSSKVRSIVCNAALCPRILARSLRQQPVHAKSRPRRHRLVGPRDGWHADTQRLQHRRVAPEGERVQHRGSAAPSTCKVRAAQRGHEEEAAVGDRAQPAPHAGGKQVPTHARSTGQAHTRYALALRPVALQHHHCPRVRAEDARESCVERGAQLEERLRHVVNVPTFNFLHPEPVPQSDALRAARLQLGRHLAHNVVGCRIRREATELYQRLRVVAACRLRLQNVV